MKVFRAVLLLVIILAITGCHSHVIHVRLTNASSQPISTIIVDYPKATFGVDSLAPGRIFQYTIKPTETGELKVQFTNAQGISHTYSGPTVQKGQEGTIEIKLSQDTVSVQPALM